MNVSVWLDGEMKEFSTLLQQFKRKQMKNRSEERRVGKECL